MLSFFCVMNSFLKTKICFVSPRWRPSLHLPLFECSLLLRQIDAWCLLRSRQKLMGNSMTTFVVPLFSSKWYMNLYKRIRLRLNGKIWCIFRFCFFKLKNSCYNLKWYVQVPNSHCPIDFKLTEFIIHDDNPFCRTFSCITGLCTWKKLS